MQINIHQLDALLFTYFWADIHTIRTYLEQNNKGGIFSTEKDVDKSPLHLEYTYNPNPQKTAFSLS